MVEQLKRWDDLTPMDVYEILRLRSEVFVVEQQCVYQDLDGKDQKSSHVLFWENQNLVAYCRILPPGISYKEISIGRVVVSPNCRNQGIGSKLTQYTIQKINEMYGDEPIRISAQSHLEKFYSQFGFQSTRKEYLEDGIPHSEMLRS